MSTTWQMQNSARNSQRPIETIDNLKQFSQEHRCLHIHRITSNDLEFKMLKNLSYVLAFYGTPFSRQEYPNGPSYQFIWTLKDSIPKQLVPMKITKDLITKYFDLKKKLEQLQIHRKIMNSYLKTIPYWMRCSDCNKWRIMRVLKKHFLSPQPKNWKCNNCDEPSVSTNQIVPPNFTELEIKGLQVLREIVREREGSWIDCAHKIIDRLIRKYGHLLNPFMLQFNDANYYINSGMEPMWIIKLKQSLEGGGVASFSFFRIHLNNIWRFAIRYYPENHEQRKRAIEFNRYSNVLINNTYSRYPALTSSNLTRQQQQQQQQQHRQSLKHRQHQHSQQQNKQLVPFRVHPQSIYQVNQNDSELQIKMRMPILEKNDKNINNSKQLSIKMTNHNINKNKNKNNNKRVSRSTINLLSSEEAEEEEEEKNDDEDDESISDDVSNSDTIPLLQLDTQNKQNIVTCNKNHPLHWVLLNKLNKEIGICNKCQCKKHYEGMYYCIQCRYHLCKQCYMISINDRDSNSNNKKNINEKPLKRSSSLGLIQYNRDKIKNIRNGIKCPVLNCLSPLTLMCGFHIDCNGLINKNIKCNNCQIDINSTNILYYHCIPGCQKQKQNQFDPHQYYCCENCATKWCKSPQKYLLKTSKCLSFQGIWTSINNKNCKILTMRQESNIVVIKNNESSDTSVKAVIQQSPNEPSKISLQIGTEIYANLRYINSSNVTLTIKKRIRNNEETAAEMYNKVIMKCIKCKSDMLYMFKNTVPYFNDYKNIKCHAKLDDLNPLKYSTLRAINYAYYHDNICKNDFYFYCPGCNEYNLCSGCALVLHESKLNNLIQKYPINPRKKRKISELNANNNNIKNRKAVSLSSNIFFDESHTHNLQLLKLKKQNERLNKNLMNERNKLKKLNDSNHNLQNKITKKNKQIDDKLTEAKYWKDKYFELQKNMKNILKSFHFETNNNCET